MAGSAGSRVNFDEDKQLVFETSANVKVVNSFDQMGFKDELLRGIYAYGGSARRAGEGGKWRAPGVWGGGMARADHLCFCVLIRGCHCARAHARALCPRRLRVREAVCDPAARDFANHQQARRHCAGAVWHGQDGHVRHLDPAKH